ncbi:MAG TPA: hypothetical protein ENG06_03065 [Thermoplasmatales archaeon]|nr:hypothetical protein [Thermoplasmatales archaeon]
MANLGNSGTVKNPFGFVFTVLIVLFLVSSAFVLSFPYPVGEMKGPHPQGMWNGGIIPDEHGYFGWAWIYYTTGKSYVPLEEVGPKKIQQVDFFIGDSPEKCIFARVEVSGNDVPPYWDVTPGNVTVSVYDGDNGGISGMRIKITEERRGLQWDGVSDENGAFSAEVPPGFYTVMVYTPDLPLKINFATDYPNLNYPIIATAMLKSWRGAGAEVNIHVDHYINRNLKDVKIYTGFDWENSEPLGETDENGNFSLTIPVQQKMYHVVAVKETENIMPPAGSVITTVDGEYVLANRWPPGYCYFIIPFWLSHTVHLITMFSCVVASISVYVLSKRLYGEKTAILATMFVLASGLGMIVMYSRGMADYATMAFSTAGIALLVESMQRSEGKNNNVFHGLLGFFGGLSLAFAVTMRYSTVTVILGPLAYILIGFIRSKSYTDTLKKDALPVLAFVLGLILVGSLLAAYNTNLFGGPLNSGYQMSTRLGTENGNITIETPEKTMFEEYFHPSWDSLHNAVGRILPQLFLLLPVLFIAPIGMFLDFRKRRAWMMFFWAAPTLLLYIQMTWVGQIPYEDMRYFLPALPPAAILSAHALNHLRREGRYDILTYILLVLLVGMGFLAAYCGIHWQIHRRELGPFFRPPLIAFIIAGLTYVLVYGMAFKRAFTGRNRN